MTGAVVPNDLMARLLDAGAKAARERAEAWEARWVDLVAADPALARLRDDPGARAEVEARADAWRQAVDGRGWTPEWSRADVLALADKVAGLRAELADLLDEARALARATDGHELGDAASALFLALAGVVDALDPADAAANALRQAPKKAGGPGKLTENLRLRSVEDFGRAMPPLFRRVGLSLGGNGSKSKSFATFLDVLHQEIEGRPIPGRGVLLADLRKR